MATARESVGADLATTSPTLRELLRAAAVGLLAPARSCVQRESADDG